MTQQAENCMRMAKASIHAAESMLAAKDYPGFIISRAYYAMFYAASAVLDLVGQTHSKHSAVISSFGRDFTHTGKLARHLHRYIIDASALRSAGDYDMDASLTEAQASEQLAHAREFVSEIEQYLSNQP